MNKAGKIIVLNYHLISDRETPALTSSDPLYSVSANAFHQQLKLLSELKIPVVSLSDLITGNFNAQFGVVLTFDDGYSSDVEIVLPALQENNFTASFFPFLDSVGQPGRVSWDQLRSLSEQGFEIGSHGVTHTVFNWLTAAEQGDELQKSKTEIENHLQKPVAHFALPYGWYSHAILDRISTAGYISALTTGLKINTVGLNNFLVYRWNIKRNTSPGTIRNILQLKGKLPVSETVISKAKFITRRIAGPALSDKANVYFKKISGRK